MEVIFDAKDAAFYAGVTLEYLRRQCKARTGPRFIMPSKHKILFRKSDLDAWIASWKVVEPVIEKPVIPNGQ